MGSKNNRTDSKSQAPPTNNVQPSILGGRWESIKHKSNCILSEHTEDITRNGGDKTWMNVLVPGSANQYHTSRLFCNCMDNYEFDKQFVLEVRARNLLREAFHWLRRMTAKYGLSAVLGDIDLRRTVLEFMHMKQLVVLLNINPGIPEKARKKTPDLCDRFESKFVKNEHNQQDEKDLISNLLFASEIVGTYGQLFEDVLNNKVNHTNNLYKESSLITSPWQACLFEEDIKVWVRPTSVGKIDFRIEALMKNTSVFDLLAMLSETELAETWMPYYKFPFRLGLKSAKLLGRFGRFSKVSQFLVDLPLGFPNVEALVHAQLADDLECNQNFVLTMKSFNSLASQSESECWPITKNKEMTGYERVNFGGGGVFQSFGNHTEMKTIFCCEVPIQTQFSPTLINFVGGTFVKIAVKKFTEAMHQRRDIFEEARKNDQWFYGFIEDRIGDLEEAGFDPLQKESTTTSPENDNSGLTTVKGYHTTRARSYYTTVVNQ